MKPLLLVLEGLEESLEGELGQPIIFLDQGGEYPPKSVRGRKPNEKLVWNILKSYFIQSEIITEFRNSLYEHKACGSVPKQWDRSFSLWDRSHSNR